MRWFGALHAALLKGAVTQGPRVPKVAVTFDDGPDPSWTPLILDILDAHQAKATFFVLGDQLDAHRRLAEEVADRGHELASHLKSHDRAVADDDERFGREMRETADSIRAITGRLPRYMRFPFAYTGRQTPRAVREEFDITAVHWSFSGMDSRLDAGAVVRRVNRRLYPGAIVLLHDGVGKFSKYVKHRQATVDALPAVLARCREMALAPVTLSELMAAT